MKKKNWLISLILAGVMCLSLSGNVFAADMTILLDGNKIVSDVVPEVRNGTTFVPLRVVSENLGAVVYYQDGTVTIAREDRIVVLSLDGQEAKVRSADGQEQTVNLDGGVFVNNGRTMVPLRFVAEAMDMQVNYLPGEQRITVTGREPLVVDGISLKYATTYSRIGMSRSLKQYSGYGEVAAMHESLQSGILREVAEPETDYGSMFEISDYYMEQYMVGFYDEEPLRKENSGENATDAALRLVLYKMLEGTPEYGGDSRHLLYDMQKDKWYVFAAESYDEFVRLLAGMDGVLLEAM